jgi:hypothetical protein
MLPQHGKSTAPRTCFICSEQAVEQQPRFTSRLPSKAHVARPCTCAVQGEGGPEVTWGEKVEMSAEVEYSSRVYFTTGMGQSAGGSRGGTFQEEKK